MEMPEYPKGLMEHPQAVDLHSALLWYVICILLTLYTWDYSLLNVH